MTATVPERLTGSAGLTKLQYGNKLSHFGERIVLGVYAYSDTCDVANKYILENLVGQNEPEP
jgi:hypothetical protein